MSYTKPSAAELKRSLSPLQYEVTQRDATEPPFRNAFWDHHDEGLYVDVVTGEPLFASVDKFDSGTGWPSFTQPVEPGRVVSRRDATHGMVRVEVRSSAGDSHLGHVFDDGPAPSRMRFCINSASLRFVPRERLEADGYGAYAARFGRAEASRVAASSDNACAVPAPGERPGCEATLDTAVLGGDAYVKAALERVAGVLEVEIGMAAGIEALRVTFDPKALPYRELLDRWDGAADGGAASRAIFSATDAQRQTAEAWGRSHAGRAALHGAAGAGFRPGESSPRA